jgi:tRNA threonylcarbamoyladenosine biosynthesis protein TsaE
MDRRPATNPPTLLTLALADLAATDRLARRLAPLLRPGDFVGLAGDLGTGKTTFARFVIAAISGQPEEVPSPTFNLVLVYAFPRLTIWHVDLYRLRAPEEANELGIEDALAEGVALVEWPDRLGPYVPDDRLVLEFREAEAPGARLVMLAAYGAWADRARDLAS